ncbi:MAG: glycosyltransferase family 4 protein [Phocaeicola sp.]|uniref:glycosyltransferase family 4 protein n=1 Tax=Phocaeicola sp. TaxID=2773926 RepID=UPI003FA19112
MRILIVNTSERVGGAAIAANRLMTALINNGIKAKMLVRDKQTNNTNVVQLKRSWKTIWDFLWERFVIWAANRFSKKELFAVDIANTGTDITSLPEFTQADIIHLNWINQGMLSMKDIQKIIRSGKPIVWTMHDMWPITGICHHAEQCEKYYTSCHSCPHLQNSGKKDLSYKVYQQKKRIYKDANITFVGCSRWIANRARKSGLAERKEVIDIPNPLNVNLFKSHNKQEARKYCHLPKDKKLLLFGSAKITNKQKGINYLIEACNLIAQSDQKWSKKLGVVVLGQNGDQFASLFPFPCYVLNYVRTEKDLVNIYNAVDIYITPSLMENLPNTIMEAMACGVPCVGFNIGGIPEMIDHLHNGYVAIYKSAEDLANGIKWILSDDYKNLSDMACQKVASTYSENQIAKQYINLYNKITNDNA